MERNRGFRRKKNFSKARHKKKIAKKLYGDDLYDHDGQYIKGKVHCSCPCCSPKTNNHGNYGKQENYKHSDEQKIESMESQVDDFLKGRINNEND